MIHMYGLNYCADHTNGKLYEYSLDIYSDDGQHIIKQRDTAAIHGGLFGVPGQKLNFDEVEFIILNDTGEVEGTGLGPQPPDEEPESTIVTIDVQPPAGIAATQSNFTGDVDHTHPFNEEVWSQMTQAVVFKCSKQPTAGNDQEMKCFNVGGGNMDVGIGTQSGAAGIYEYLGLQFDSSRTVGGHNNIICSDRLSIRAQPGWSWDHWYCIAGSFDGTTDTFLCAFTNLTLGETINTVGNTYPLNGNAIGWEDIDTTDWSKCMWGCGGVNTVLNPYELIWPFYGSLSQIWIDDSFIDLSSGNPFCNSNTVKDLGDNGNLVTGSIPKVYMPYGHPSLNNGTADCGTWDVDFFFKGDVNTNGNGNIPPTTPNTELEEPFWQHPIPEPGDYIDLSKLNLTTYQALFGVTVEGADFDAVFSVGNGSSTPTEAALVNTSDSGNIIQLTAGDGVTYLAGSLHITTSNGTIYDSMIFPQDLGNTVSIPTGDDFYIIIQADTGDAHVKKWDSTP